MSFYEGSVKIRYHTQNRNSITNFLNCEIQLVNWTFFFFLTREKGLEEDANFTKKDNTRSNKIEEGLCYMSPP